MMRVVCQSLLPERKENPVRLKIFMHDYVIFSLLFTAFYISYPSILHNSIMSLEIIFHNNLLIPMLKLNDLWSRWNRFMTIKSCIYLTKWKKKSKFNVSDTKKESSSSSHFNSKSFIERLHWASKAKKWWNEYQS